MLYTGNRIESSNLSLSVASHAAASTSLSLGAAAAPTSTTWAAEQLDRVAYGPDADSRVLEDRSASEAACLPVKSRQFAEAGEHGQTHCDWREAVLQAVTLMPAILAGPTRAIAQFGSAFDWGSKGRGFKSR